MNLLQRLDDRLLLDVNTFARDTPWLHTPFLDYAKYGLVVFGLLLAAGLVVSRHRDSRLLAAAGWAGVATMLAVALNQPAGHLFGESRPYVAHPAMLRLADVTSDFSFPSDHATMAGAVAAGLLLVDRRLGLLALAAGLLMGFARVYVGAHYPWDILAGFTLGASVVLLGWLVLQRPLVALTGWLRRQPGLRAVFAERASDDLALGVGAVGA